MVGGAPSIGGGPQLPPTIRESETQAIVEVTKKYVLSLVLDTLKEAVPFTQREYNELFKYQSEASRPMLPPLLQLRTSGIESYGSRDESWRSNYQELFNALPENVQNWVTWEMSLPFAERDPSYVLVNNLLTTTASALTWLSHVGQPVAVNSQAEQNLVKNSALPFIALSSSVLQAEVALDIAGAWLNSVGANHAHFDQLSNFMGQMGNALIVLEDLKNQVGKGTKSLESQQKFVEIAYEFDRLSTLFHATNQGTDLQIIGTQLDTLAIISASWALSYGSPSLLLATTLATIGFSSDASAAGAVGTAYKTAINLVLSGLLNSVGFGPREELKEMTQLYNDLLSLN